MLYTYLEILKLLVYGGLNSDSISFPCNVNFCAAKDSNIISVECCTSSIAEPIGTCLHRTYIFYVYIGLHIFLEISSSLLQVHFLCSSFLKKVLVIYRLIISANQASLIPLAYYRAQVIFLNF